MKSEQREFENARPSFLASAIASSICFAVAFLFIPYERLFPFGSVLQDFDGFSMAENFLFSGFVAVAVFCSCRALAYLFWWLDYSRDQSVAERVFLPTLVLCILVIPQSIPTWIRAVFVIFFVFSFLAYVRSVKREDCSEEKEEGADSLRPNWVVHKPRS